MERTRKPLMSAEDFDRLAVGLTGKTVKAARDVLVNGATMRGAGMAHGIANTNVKRYVEKLLARKILELVKEQPQQPSSSC